MGVSGTHTPSVHTPAPLNSKNSLWLPSGLLGFAKPITVTGTVTKQVQVLTPLPSLQLPLLCFVAPEGPVEGVSWPC
jgi:hypothetical protein